MAATLHSYGARVSHVPNGHKHTAPPEQLQVSQIRKETVSTVYFRNLKLIGFDAISQTVKTVAESLNERDNPKLKAWGE